MEVLSKRIEQFLSVSYGYDDGYGNGSGNGSGNGGGYGSGNGYGYGYSSGYGGGYGDGYGNGYGNGYGYGYGYGSGNGSGITEINGMKVWEVDNTPTIITNIHGNIAKGYTLQNNVILVPCYIAKVDDCFAHGKTAHDALRDATAKALQKTPIEERIAKVREQYPSLDTVVSHKKLYSLHNILTGSCEFGRREFASSHGLDPENGEMTMREFIKLTLNAYGGENIKLLAEAYNI